LILSGLAELDHKIKGLGFGADDFLTKPFDRRELVARIQAIVRRSKGHPTPPDPPRPHPGAAAALRGEPEPPSDAVARRTAS
jgi:DNA-binding response OmpR family regulator